MPAESVEDLKRQIRQIDDLRAAGTLSEESAQQARMALEKRLVEAVMASPSLPPPMPPSASPAGAAAAPAAAPVPASARPSRRLLAGIGAFVLVFTAAGAWWLGSAEGWRTGPGERPAGPPIAQAEPDAAPGPAGAASSPHPMAAAQVEAMVDNLARRLAQEPQNVDGWLMLGRSYAVLGRFEPAIAAFRRVLALEPKHAQALADLADALAMTQERRFEGEPAQLVQQALAADPANLKALLLAGTIAFDRGDYATAQRHWNEAVRVGPADSALVEQARAGVTEARALAGGAPGGAAAPMTASPAPAATSGNPPAPAAGATLRGRVSLSPALAAKASPDDTVFVFARAAEGPRMPLAIVKKRVRDLPFDFTLDDSQAMTPQARLSQATRVVVGARVSKSGQAMPQPGDLEVLSAPMAPGASGLSLVIADTVR